MTDTTVPPITHSRVLVLEGAFNARDLGGLRAHDGRVVRRRRILRSANLHRLTTADVDLLHELGVRTVFDLRSDDEVRWTGTGPLYERGVVIWQQRAFYGPSIVQTESDMTPEERRRRWLERGYESMLEIAAPAIADIFARLAEDDTYPLMIHCVAGKDRTGVLSALILRTLGVPDADIVHDYALTAEHRPDDATLREMMADYGIILEERPNFDPWQTPPQVMEATLRVLDERWNGHEGYLRQAGVSDAQLRALRELMLQEG